MCLHIPDSQKKQPAKGLPSGWTFIFSRDKHDTSKSGQAHTPGLFIHHPECDKSFRSIEAAVSYLPKLKTFNRSVVTDFKMHIGVLGASDEKGSNKKRAGSREITISQKSKSSHSSVDTPKGMTGGTLSPQEMYVQQCGNCELCVKPACGSCFSCRSNRKAPSHIRRVCLQKVRHDMVHP